MRASVELEEKVRFIGRASGDQAVVIDYPPPLGDDAGLRGGLELLLMAFAACAGQTVVPILRRLNQRVLGCRVEARGERRDEHPTVVTDVHLEFTFSGAALDAAAVERAISIAEKQICPVWAMLKGSTRITSSYRITCGV